jgi:hypothetical protein
MEFFEIHAPIITREHAIHKPMVKSTPRYNPVRTVDINGEK